MEEIKNKENWKNKKITHRMKSFVQKWLPTEKKNFWTKNSKKIFQNHKKLLEILT